jgi:hypothetical protein
MPGQFDDLDLQIAFQDPECRADADIKLFNASVRRALRRFTLKPSERDEFAALAGDRAATERLVASNRRLRKKATLLLMEEFASLRADPDLSMRRSFRHYSFLGPVVNEYQTEIDIDAYRSVVDRLLRSAKLNAVFAIELQALTNYPQRRLGRSFLLNAHALAWSDDPAVNHDDLVAHMRSSRSLHSHLGAPTVVCTPRTSETGELERLAYYMLKAPAVGKRRQRDPEIPSRFKFTPVNRVRSDLRLRLFEILSQLELTDLVHGTLDGKFLRRRWTQQVVAWNKERCTRLRPLDADYDTAALWENVRARDENGSRRFKPVRFFGPVPRPTSHEALPRAGGKRLRPGIYRFWSAPAASNSAPICNT